MTIDRPYAAILAEAWQQQIAPRADGAPTVLSTFAGAGGSVLGYRMAGFRDVLAVEWGANACATLRLNFPDLAIYEGDIARLTTDEILQRTALRVGALDVLDGSPPCQGFSPAGRRRLDDERNDLWREFARLVRTLQPKTFVMENVPGLVKGKMKLIFAEMLRGLKDCGYQVKVRRLNAMYFQVPQSRQRLIFIGVRDDLQIAPTHPRAQSRPIVYRDAVAGLTDGKQQGANVTPLRAKRWRETPRGKNHHERFSLNRLAWDKVAPTTLKTSGSGGQMHPDEPRLLNVGELCRIGSFPDEYRFVGTWDNAVCRIGNSVPPLLMRQIARHVRRTVLDQVDARDDSTQKDVIYG